MSKINTLHQTSSEVNTLATRGYRLLNKLGEGSYAKVYLGEYRSTSDTAPATLACKVIDTKKVTKNFLNKFLPRELDVLVKINHPHIIHVHSIFQRRTKYYIFMRYAENGDLLDFILKDGAISEPQTRFWVRQIALALQYLHRMQIAHRDIKCENILVTSNNNVKLCDFGFTRYVVDAQNRRVLSETFCGSLSYAAPEILKGLAYAPKISDMWALGVLVFTMLNKAMPFDDTHATVRSEDKSLSLSLFLWNRYT